MADLASDPDPKRNTPKDIGGTPYQGSTATTPRWVKVFGTVMGALVLLFDAQMVRAAYLAMELTTWFVIVPLAFISLLSGVVTSLGTNWGLFRYYWVLLKLLITVLATIVLLVHLQPIDLLAGAAAKTTVFSADLQSLQLLMVTASSAALVVLIVLAVLSVYKPRGMTQFGLRKQRALSQPTAAMRPCSDGGDALNPFVATGQRPAASNEPVNSSAGILGAGACIAGICLR